MRILESVLFMLAGIVIGALLYAVFLCSPKSKANPMPDVKQQILLERIKKVAKLVTVEGEFANVHEYKNFYWADISIFNKKALLKVQAKVSVGYDLQKLTWEIDSVNKVIKVSNMPQPEIISIDHSVQYYDMHEGMFNTFKESELTDINIVIKQKLREATEKGPLMDKAKEEGLEQLEIIKLLVEQAGWTFVSTDGNLTEPQDSLKKLNIPVPNKKEENSFFN
jgi:hypothetical protein